MSRVILLFVLTLFLMLCSVYMFVTVCYWWYMLSKENNIAIGMDTLNDTTTGNESGPFGDCEMTTEQEVVGPYPKGFCGPAGAFASNDPNEIRDFLIKQAALKGTK